MDQSNVKRRLTCILAADAVGYSGQMGVDEEGTARVLAAHRAVIDGIIAFHNGRIIGTAGDSVLAEFSSVVEAVRCAVEIQDALKTRNDALPEQRRMLFRIGINLGDVMVNSNDLLGDGVNIAARLEGIAEPGGICIASSVYDQITGKLDLGFLDIGDQKLKNISRPIRVYRVSGALPASTVAPAPPVRRSFSSGWIVLGIVTITAIAAWQAGWLRVGANGQGAPKTAVVSPAPPVPTTAQAGPSADSTTTRTQRAAEADAARIRAKAASTAAQTRTELPPAKDGALSGTTNTSPTKAKTVASAYDGTWNVTVVCQTHSDGALGYTLNFMVQVKDGFLSGAHGVENTPGWLRLQGPIQPNGAATLVAQGVTGDQKYNMAGTARGIPYSYTAAVRFEGAHGSGRRMQKRACDLDFVKM